jgi:transposase InsO family protein
MPLTSILQIDIFDV